MNKNLKFSLVFKTLASFILLLLVQAVYAQKNLAPIDNQHVIINTTMGTIKIKLYDATPQHRDNFVKLVKQSFYDSLLFHRVIKEFMIQGGDPQSKNAAAGMALGMGDVGYQVPAEFVDSLFHQKGALAAARDNNPAKASSGCQFYLVQGKKFTAQELDMVEQRMGFKYSQRQRDIYMNIGGTPHLDKNYTVYGQIIEGMDVLDKIANVATAPGDRPLVDVRMYMKMEEPVKKKKGFLGLWKRK